MAGGGQLDELTSESKEGGSSRGGGRTQMKMNAIEHSPSDLVPSLANVAETAMRIT